MNIKTSQIAPYRVISLRAHETAFDRSVRLYGPYAAVRQARNLGIDFIDCYVMRFGCMPRVL
jgi:hypothetical protein